MKTVLMLAVTITAWVLYFQIIDWFFMKIQGLNYFAFLAM